MSTYYKILDKNLIGRQDGMFDCYIFNSEKGWLRDSENILMDHIIGYDENSIGNSDMLDRVEEITENEALELIKQ